MSLRILVRLAVSAPLVLWFLAHAWFVGPRRLLEGWKLWSLAVAAAVGITISNVVARRALTRYRQALAQEDILEARRQHSMLADFWRLRGREIMKAYGANILMVEGRYQEALTELQALDLKRIGHKGAPVITNQIAWCMAHLGEPEAIELARSVFQQLEGMGSDYSSSAHLVLGVCELFQSRPSEAVPHLEKACANPNGAASGKATAAFYLGESFSALGNAAEAHHAYQRAYAALPHGKFGIRALERLREFPSNA